MYNTFPLMNGQVIPTGMGTVEPLYLNFINNPVTVQFIHRIFAFVLLFLVAKVWWTSKKTGMNPDQRKAMNIVLLAVSVQFLLGVLTLLTKVDITMASLHQIGAFFLFSSVIYLLFQMRKIRTAA